MAARDRYGESSARRGTSEAGRQYVLARVEILSSIFRRFILDVLNNLRRSDEILFRFDRTLPLTLLVSWQNMQSHLKPQCCRLTGDSLGSRVMGDLYQKVISVLGGRSLEARAIIMSPMKERRALLRQEWLMYDAIGQTPLEWNCLLDFLSLSSSPFTVRM